MKKIAETKDFKRLSKTTGIPIEELSQKIIAHIEEKQGWEFGKVDLTKPEHVKHLIRDSEGWNSAIMLQEITGYYKAWIEALFVDLYIVWEEQDEDDGVDQMRAEQDRYMQGQTIML